MKSQQNKKKFQDAIRSLTKNKNKSKMEKSINVRLLLAVF